MQSLLESFYPYAYAHVTLTWMSICVLSGCIGVWRYLLWLGRVMYARSSFSASAFLCLVYMTTTYHNRGEIFHWSNHLTVSCAISTHVAFLSSGCETASQIWGSRLQSNMRNMSRLPQLYRHKRVAVLKPRSWWEKLVSCPAQQQRIAKWYKDIQTVCLCTVSR